MFYSLCLSFGISVRLADVEYIAETCQGVLGSQRCADCDVPLAKLEKTQKLHMLGGFAREMMTNLEQI